MYTLDKPPFNVAEILTTCLDAIEDTDLCTRLKTIRAHIVGGALSYDSHALAATLHLLPRVASIGTVTKDELVALYSDHLSGARGAARDVYNAIKGAVPNKLCPLCSIGSVAHLDHHLPKRKYPDLSILPLNLVPACHLCNDTKKARYPNHAGEQTFHPYYDGHLLNEQWVRGTLNQGSPPVVVFSATAPATWAAVDRQRVERHFLICGVVTSYMTNANSLMSSLKKRLTKLHERGGAAAVEAHLDEERETFEDKLNSWQHVFYQTLAANSWFVNGGFQTIA
jgi:hypothetical protein